MPTVIVQALPPNLPPMGDPVTDEHIWIDAWPVAPQTVLIIQASGSILYYPAGGKWYDPDGDVGYFIYTEPSPMPDADIGSLIGRIVNSNGQVINGPFKVGKDYNNIKDKNYITKSGMLQLAIQDIYTGYRDNAGSFTVVEIEGETSCPPHEDTNYPFATTCGACDVSSANPITLRDGNKLFSETDLSLPTLAGPLSFIRTYNQKRQYHPDFQFMGMGWTHNHIFDLSFSGTTPNRSAKIIVPGGGILYLDEDGTTTRKTFRAQAGSRAILENELTDGNEGSSWILTAEDKSQYVFDLIAGKNRIQSHQWPSGEIWQYDFDEFFGETQLSEVADAYGNQLVFDYLQDSETDEVLLKSVSDQAGRSVQFSYAPEKIAGISLATVYSLLVGVEDVRGQAWQYHYYGQEANETAPAFGNLLTKRLSPMMEDSNQVILEAITYHFAPLFASDMETSGAWSAVAGATAAQSDEFLHSGDYAWHVEAAATGEGIESTETFDLEAGQTYLIGAYVYYVYIEANANPVEMKLSGLSSPTIERHETEIWLPLRLVYTPDTALSNQRLQFLAADGASEFYVDDVQIIAFNRPDEIIQERGNGLLETEFVFPTSTDFFTEETQAGQITRYHFADDEGQTGTYQFKEIELSGLESLLQNRQALSPQYRPINQLDGLGQATIYDWSSDGGLLELVFDPLGGTTHFEYLAGDLLEASIDTGGRKTLYVYDDENNPRQPTERIIYETEDTEADFLQKEEYEYDEAGRLIAERLIDNDENILRETEREYHGSGLGEGLLHQVIQRDLGSPPNDHITTYSYDDVGRVIQTQQNSNFGSCRKSQTLYDDAGQVLASYCNIIEGDASASSNSGDATKAFDANSFTYWASTGMNSESLTYELESDARVINGLALMARRADLGEMPVRFTVQASHDDDNWDDIAVDLTHEGAWERQEIQVFSFPNETTYRYWRVQFLETADELASRFSLSGLFFLSAGETQFTIHQYDALGRRISTIAQAGTAFAHRDYTLYDALDRVIGSISNYVPSYLDEEEVEQDYAPPSTWHWTGSEWQDGDDIPIQYGALQDQNIISQTFYNLRGQVRKTLDVLGHATLFGYDPAGRLVRTVRNPHDPDYNNDYAGEDLDPDLSAYFEGLDPAPDLDITTFNTYDANGNFVIVEDTSGQRSFSVYDALNRVVKTVRNAKEAARIDLNPGDTGYAAADDPRSDAYEPSPDADEDLISQTIYDEMGRVIETQELTDNGWRITRHVYDHLDRQTKSIQNYIPIYLDEEEEEQAYAPPDTWHWTGSEWQDGDEVTIGVLC